MDFETLVKKVEGIDARVAKLENPTPVEAAPPAPAAPAVEFDDDGFLKGGRSINGARVDPVVPEGTARTVTLGETGHTVSIARVDKGESFPGFCIRVVDQCHGDIGRVGALFMGADWLFDKWGGFKADGTNWPFAADRFYNGHAFGDPVGEENTGPYGPGKNPHATPANPGGSGLPPGEEPL